MLLSRVADSLYWISRYLERAEHTARLIDVRLDLGLDRRRGDEAWEFDRLYAALRLTPPDDVAELGPAALVDALMFDLVEPRLGAVVRHVGARERAAGARGDQLGHVGAGQRALPAHQAGAPRARPRWRGRTTCRARSSKASTSSKASPTRRWATARAGSSCRSAASSSAPARRRRWSTCTSRPARRRAPVTIEWVGLLRSCSALEAYCRCYTADLRPRPHRRVPAAERRVPALGPVRRGAGRVGAAGRSRSSPAAAPAAAPSGSPAACTRRSTTARSTRSSTTPHAYLDGITRHAAQIHAAVYQSYVMYPIESALPA